MDKLYKKYNVTKVDGSLTDPNAQYFVLRIDTDPAARKALSAYVVSIWESNPALASQIAEWMGATPLVERPKER